MPNTPAASVRPLPTPSASTTTQVSQEYSVTCWDDFTAEDGQANAAAALNAPSCTAQAANINSPWFDEQLEFLSTEDLNLTGNHFEDRFNGDNIASADADLSRPQDQSLGQIELSSCIDPSLSTDSDLQTQFDHSPDSSSSQNHAGMTPSLSDNTESNKHMQMAKKRHGRATPEPPSPSRMKRRAHDSISHPESTTLHVRRAPPTPSEPLINQLCACVSSALTLLEALEMEDYSASSRSIAHVLQLRKQTLLRCVELISCETCTATSNFIILVILLCRKVVGSYERVVRILREQLDRDRQAQTLGFGRCHAPQQHEVTDESGEGGLAIFLRNYEMDSAEELCVFSGLIAMQLGKWRILIGQLKNRCLSLDLAMHSAMVAAVEKRVQIQLQFCAKFSTSS